MAMQHLRSSTANKRPQPTGMSDGQIAVNTNSTSPGVFVKDSAGALVKVGPVHVGTTAPNATPASGGQSGNSTGELWLDTSLTPAELKTWDGSAWQSATGQEIPVSKLADGSARQLLQTDAAGTGVEWTSNVDVPGTLDVTGAATFDSTATVTGVISANGKVSFPLGSAAAPSLYPGSDTDTGIYSPGANELAISTNGTQRLLIEADGDINIDSGGVFYDATNNRLAIGTTSPGSELHIQGALSGGQLLVATNQTNATEKYGTFGAVHYTNAEEPALGVAVQSNSTDNNVLIGGALGEFNAATTVRFYTAANNTTTTGSERARIDSSGRLLVGTSTAFGGTPLGGNLQIESSAQFGPQLGLRGLHDSSNPVFAIFDRARGSNIVQSGDSILQLDCRGYDGTSYLTAARIVAQVDGTPGTNDMPGRLVFSTTADGASSPTERMRITQGGDVLIAKTTNDLNTQGIRFSSVGVGAFARDGDIPLFVNRNTNDGGLVVFRQDGVDEGGISVSGTTVSYNGAHLSRWSQLPSGQERTEILRGTVLSNIDEMCEWGDEDNEQLNRMKVSDVEGDKNVSGVFQAWDDDDDTYTNDFYCAMTGDFIIRIAAGVTIERGDLLMSAGDGTAKPQDDDIIRSKTIAKVTSTNVSCTYDDGSYCVPCVLMAC